MIATFATRIAARWPVIPTRRFVAAGILAIVVSRVAVILLTPSTADFPDARIYQATGQAVLEGANPYDSSDNVPARVKLQTSADRELRDSNWTDSLSEWNLVIRSNLPAVSALCAGFEAIADGSRTAWRYLLILGDIAMFLGLLSLLRQMRGTIADRTSQLLAVFLVIGNTLLVLDGTVVPEVKQFETALLLFSAAFLISKRPPTLVRSVIGGLVISLSVLFMLFGIFLLPLWFVRSIRDWPRFALATSAGALIPLVGSFAYFGTGWLDTIGVRGAQDSVGDAGGASFWYLIPGLHGDALAVVKLVVVVALAALLCALLFRRRIDLLNACAGWMVVFDCVFLVTGTMNRMNIAFVFAFAALAARRATAALAIAAGSTGLAFVGYGFAFTVLHRHINPEFSLALLVAYFTALVLPAARTNHWADQPGMRPTRRASRWAGRSIDQ
jgi:hypothetical protein